MSEAIIEEFIKLIEKKRSYTSSVFVQSMLLNEKIVHSIKFLITWILYDNHNEVFVRCNHDLMLLRSNSQECQIIGWVEITNN